MSMSRSEERIVELLRSDGRMRATIVHMAAHSKTMDDELLEMAEELETLRGDLPRKHEEETDGEAAEASGEMSQRPTQMVKPLPEKDLKGVVEEFLACALKGRDGSTATRSPLRADNSDNTGCPQGRHSYYYGDLS